MSDTPLDADALRANLLQKLSAKRADRRRFLRNAGGLTVGLAGGTILGACGGGSSSNAVAQPPPDTGPSDVQILNFALNLEYLEAAFYQRAIGMDLPNEVLNEDGAGTITGGMMVDFSGEPLIAQYAREIAEDELAHVQFLRTALGSSAVVLPDLDIGPAFAAAASAAGLGPGFDAYSSPDNFLLGAYIFEDVGVTAYKGASPFVDNPDFLEAAAGILAAEAYHAGIIRTVLYARGVQSMMEDLHQATLAISDLRDSVDDGEKDQGVVETDGMGMIQLASDGVTPLANLVPLDENGIAFSRSVQEVLNIVYLNGAGTPGGFFPNGINPGPAS